MTNAASVTCTMAGASTATCASSTASHATDFVQTVSTAGGSDTCVVSTCDDGLKNGDEDDTDCGGADCCACGLVPSSCDFAKLLAVADKLSGAGLSNALSANSCDLVLAYKACSKISAEINDANLQVGGSCTAGR